MTVTRVASCLVALAMLAGTGLLTPLVSSADAREVRDAPGDVWSWTTTSSGHGRFAHSSARANVDIARFVVRQRDREVRVRVTYADLRRHGASYGVGVDFVTDEGVRRHAAFVAGAGTNWLGSTRLLDRRRSDVSCARKHTHASYRRDSVWMAFPRRCFGNPTWVRFKAMTYRRTADGLLVDNPHNEQPLTERWSPRVGRGD